VHEHKQLEPYSPTRRLREATLWFSGENSNTAASQPGASEYPHSRPAPLTLDNSREEQSPTVSRSLVPEPVLCVEVTQLYLAGTAPPPTPAPVPPPLVR